jgi:ribose-phosphate pyrophosphokinase
MGIVSIKASSGGKCWFDIRFKSWLFPGGEVGFQLLDTLPLREFFIIRTNLVSAGNLLELLMATDAIRRAYKGARISLVCPYLPYARQDRVTVLGASLSLRVLADLINSQGYESVEIWDAHSDVALALINNVNHREQLEFVSQIHWSDFCVLAPDQGAIKKASKAAEFFKAPLMVCDKHRDPGTGKITEIHVPTSLNDNILIVDDICDGGWTFIQLAEKLKLQGCTVVLYVTHGIFSGGLYTLRNAGIEKVYTANVWPFVNHMQGYLTLLGDRDET